MFPARVTFFLMRSWTSNSKTCAGSFELYLHDFQYYLPGSGHHSWNNSWPTCLENPSWFFFYFPGSGEMRAQDQLSQLLHIGTHLSCGDLWIIRRGDDACLCTSTSCKAQCLSYRINWISKMWGHRITFLTWRKEKRNVAGNKQSKKIQKKPWLLQFTILIWQDPSWIHSLVFF